MSNLKIKKNAIKISQNFIIINGRLGKIKWPLMNNLFILKDNTFFLKKKKKNYFYNLIKFLLNSVNYGWSFEFSIVGKGFKLFKYNNNLAFDLGYSNLLLFKNKNKDIKILISKKKLIFYSVSKKKIFNLIHLFKSFYYIDKYHQKGLSFKNDKKRYIYKKLM